MRTTDKLCVDCKHYRPFREVLHLCYHPKNVERATVTSPVDGSSFLRGMEMKCSDARRGPCFDGALFERYESTRTVVETHGILWWKKHYTGPYDERLHDDSVGDNVSWPCHD